MRRSPSRRQPIIISEELFRSVLIRERKRAHRSLDPFVLMRVEISAPLLTDSSAIWEGVLAAVAAAKRDADIMGWIDWRAVIGVVLIGVAESEADVARARFDARVRRELALRLDVDTVDRMSIRVHCETEPAFLEEEGRPFVPDRRLLFDAVKRGQDLVFSLALLILLSPLFLVIAVLVKCGSRGPVFFPQVRIGHRMKPFRMLKFRTMRCDADPKLHHDFVSAFIKDRNRHDEPGTSRVFKLVNDPRVTPVGRILRKTSFDELPQLWNVLRGDMSLVGPRPPLPYELEQYQPWHCRRVLEAKPGMTGLWQVSGRSRTTFDEMVRLDLRYARTRSLWADIKILLATPAAVISGKGAR